MNHYQTLRVVTDAEILNVTLNRPKYRNAFNGELMKELTSVFESVNPGLTRIVALSGEGDSFCAGADLKWMQTEGLTVAQARESSMDLFRMYSAICDLEAPLVTYAFGQTFAGGVGLCAASDIVYADPSTVFCISETRVGLIPAVMSPFVVERMGLARFRELTISARKFNASEAHSYGLVDRLLPAGSLREAFRKELALVLENGPEALRATKALCRSLRNYDWQRSAQDLVEKIAERRASSEGQEGLRAFLEKRLPSWRQRGESQ